VPDAKAFLLASTLRQFREIWNVEERDRGRGLVNILRARLLQLPGGKLSIAPTDLQRLSGQEADPTQLEAVLGPHGAQTFKWWKTGLTRALSVVSIRPRLGTRMGSGFLVQASDIGVADEGLVILTNFHVVNTNGVSPGIRPDQAEVVFEALDGTPAYSVEKLLWSSPPEQCDVSVLRLSGQVSGVEPLPVTNVLPALDRAPQVYVIGYPGGRDLSFSFQDNELLDHEGPPNGRPQIPGVCRVHYRAPTEGGSSGSPVFDSSEWKVIALHHKGGKIGMPRLNGAAGTYASNEGIAIQSIVEMRKV
jgi:Trypsin-like peptidase domain